MKTGQRAYIVIKNAGAEIRLASATWGGGDIALVGLHYSYEIHNLGRTPATILDTRSAVSLPDGWHPFGPDMFKHVDLSQMKLGWQGYISQSGTERAIEIKGYTVSGEARKELLEYFTLNNDPARRYLANMPIVSMSTGLEFVDVFGDRHTVTWHTRAEVSAVANDSDERDILRSIDWGLHRLLSQLR
jgi:hypothetical protein